MRALRFWCLQSVVWLWSPRRTVSNWPLVGLGLDEGVGLEMVDLAHVQVLGEGVWLVWVSVPQPRWRLFLPVELLKLLGSVVQDWLVGGRGGICDYPRV
jgi:hypothetical protein